MTGLTTAHPAAMARSRPDNRAWAPWAVLVGRTAVLATVQLGVALGFALTGSPTAWQDAIDWWLLNVALANGICLAVLVVLLRAEGRRYRDLLAIRRGEVVRDLLILLGLTLLIGPVSMAPNAWLAGGLFGDPQAVSAYLFRPLPVWGVYVSAGLFAVTQGMVELALYFAYVMPRLSGVPGTRPAWWAWALSSTLLGLQHVAAPMHLDIRYAIWRGLMFMPFAFLVGAALRWRPQLLPYLAVGHALMDLSVGLMLAPLSY
jgi:hypothetical protein